MAHAIDTAVHPVPFEIHRDEATGHQAASNGQLLLVLRDPAGRIFRRRGVRGLMRGTPADVLLPKLNEFLGELLQQPNMSPQAAAARLQAIAGLLPCDPPQQIEWAVMQLDDVYVYSDGANVVVTKEDLYP